jgi:hypothetical protein
VAAAEHTGWPLDGAGGCKAAVLLTATVACPTIVAFKRQSRICSHRHCHMYA